MGEVFWVAYGIVQGKGANVLISESSVNDSVPIMITHEKC